MSRHIDSQDKNSKRDEVVSLPRGQGRPDRNRLLKLREVKNTDAFLKVAGGAANKPDTTCRRACI